MKWMTRWTLALIALAACAWADEARKVSCPESVEKDLHNLVWLSQQYQYLEYYRNPTKTPDLKYWERDGEELMFVLMKGHFLKRNGWHYGTGTEILEFTSVSVELFTTSKKSTVGCEDADSAQVRVREEWILKTYNRDDILMERTGGHFGPNTATYFLTKRGARWVVSDSDQPRPGSRQP